MNEEIKNDHFVGSVHNYYPFTVEGLFSYQTIKDSEPCSIFILYGKEVSSEELVDFLLKHKPETLTQK